MKKRIIILLLLCLCVISIILCFLVPKKIKFDSWGKGFVHLSELKEIKTFPPEAILITSVDDWTISMNKYLIMIGPVTSNSLPENKALLMISLPSTRDYKESSFASYTIENIKKHNNELIVYVNLNNEPTITSDVEIKSLFYEPFLINLDDINKETKIRIVKNK
jgi:hypothetical protein